MRTKKITKNEKYFVPIYDLGANKNESIYLLSARRAGVKRGVNIRTAGTNHAKKCMKLAGRMFVLEGGGKRLWVGQEALG